MSKNPGYAVEAEGMSIVAIGSFNPAIFHPQWFERMDLIRQEEASDAKVEVVHPEITVFETEWFSVQVTSDRLAVATNDPGKYLPLKDLVQGTFRLLEHSPIRAFGFNSNRHVRLESSERWAQLQEQYAPRNRWCELLEEPRLRVLIMEGRRSDCEAKRIRVQVEPSARVDGGVFVNVNEHYAVADDEVAAPGAGTVLLQRILDARWREFRAFSDKVLEDLVVEGTQG